MEKPILFNSEMVKAILDDRKLMTRRTSGLKRINQEPDLWEWGGINKFGQHIFYPTDKGEKKYPNFYPADFDGLVKCPFGKAGDRLWVRETWCVHQRYDAIPPRILPETKYLQNGITYLADVYKGEKSLWMGKTRSSIFMPRWASRISLEIVDMRVERIQDISEDDAWDEGINEKEANKRPYINKYGVGCATAVFSNLWESINGKRGYGWAENPWVWAISFKKEGEKVKKN